MKMKITNHGTKRMLQRHIPGAFVEECIRVGQRTVFLSRNAYEYRMKNVLGIRGVNLVVVQGFDGNIITTFVERVAKYSKRRRETD